MAKKITTESGLQLLARLYKRPSLFHLDDILFPGGPDHDDIAQISGQPSVGKSMLLLKFLTKSLLPKSYEGIDIGGLGAGVILIDTDHNISVLKLVTFMEQFIHSASLNHGIEGEKAKMLKDPAQVEKITVESLKRLIVFKTYSSLQLEMNFHSLKIILSANSNISVIMIDSLTSYYWSDITNEKSIKKMDLYLKVLLDKLKKSLEEFKIFIIFVTQEYFQCKQTKYTASLIKHKIDLKKSEDSEDYVAYIDSQKSFYKYCLSEKGFTWVVYSSCGYDKKFQELEAAIKSSHPDVEVLPENGTIGSFEVTVNDVLVYSKLRTLAFPDLDSVVNIVEEVSRGMPPREARQELTRSVCAIS